MNVLFVHQNFPAQYKHLVKHYSADARHRVGIVGRTPGKGGPRLLRAVYNVADKTDSQTHGYLTGFEGAVRHGQAVAGAAQQLKAKGFVPDVICVHPGWGESLYLPDVYPDAPRLDYCEFHFHAFGGAINFDPAERPTIDTLARTRMRNLVNLLSLESMSWGVAPTFWQHAQFPPEYRDRIAVCHDGVDADLCKPNPRAAVKLPDGSVLRPGEEIVTYISRNFEPVRGLATFVRAAAEICRRRPNCRIVAVGGDHVSYSGKLPEGQTYRAKMLAEVPLDPARVTFLGRVSYNAFVRLLQVSAAHIYLTMPFVLSWSMIEAMAAGCVVIASDTPPVTEVIEDGRNGLLAGFFDPAGLADRVCEAIEHPERMQEIRRQARATALARYHLRDCLPAQIGLIEDLAAGRRPPGPPPEAAGHIARVEAYIAAARREVVLPGEPRAAAPAAGLERSAG